MDKRMMVLILAAISLFLIVTIAIAAPEDFSLDWWTVDSGGATSFDDSYRLTGTIGQHDAGYLSGEQYQLSGGFWEGRESSLSFQIYLPLTVR